MIFLCFGLIIVMTFLLISRPRETFTAIVSVYVLAFVFFLQVQLFVIGGLNIYLIDIIFAAFTFYLGLTLLIRRKQTVWIKPVSFVLLVLTFIWGLVSILRGIPRYGFSAIGEARDFVYPFLFYFVFIRIYRNENQLNKFIRWILILVCVMPFFRAVTFYFLGGIESLSSIFTGSDLLSSQAQFRFIQAGESLIVACAVISLAIFLLEGKFQKKRLLMLVLIGVLFIVLVIVQIRSTWLAILGGILLIPFVIRRIPYKGILAIGISAVFALIIFIPYLTINENGAFLNSLTKSASFVSGTDVMGTGDLRYNVWRQELASMQDAFILGKGLGGYYHNTDQSGTEINIPLHNGFLTVLSKFGLIGLVILIISLITWIIEMFKLMSAENEKYYKLLFGALLASLIMHLIFAFFYNFNISFWIVLGMGTVLARIRPYAQLTTAVRTH